MTNSVPKPFYKRAWFIIVCVIVGLFIVIPIIISLANPKYFAEIEKKEQAEKDSIARAEQLATPFQKKEKSIAEIITDNQISGSDKTYLYDSIYAPNTAMMFTYIDDYWNAKSLLETHWKNSIEFAKKAFQINDIDTAIFSTKIKLTDTMGNSDTTIVLETGYKKDSFLQVKWENLREHPIYQTIATICIKAYTHPAIKNNLTIDDIQSIYY